MLNLPKTPEETRRLLAKYNGNHVLPADLRATVNAMRTKDNRKYYQKYAKKNLAKGLTVGGTPRKQDYRFHPQLKGLVGRAYHAAYMRLWRGKAA